MCAALRSSIASEPTLRPSYPTKMLERSWQMFGWSTCIHTRKISLDKHANFMLGHITCKDAKFIVIPCHSRCLPLTSALAATYTMCTFQNLWKQMFWSVFFAFYLFTPNLIHELKLPEYDYGSQNRVVAVLNLLMLDRWKRIAAATYIFCRALAMHTSKSHSGRKQLWCLLCWQHLHNSRKGPCHGSFRNGRYIFLRTLPRSIYHIDLQSSVRFPDFSALSLAIHPTNATLLWSAMVTDLR